MDNNQNQQGQQLQIDLSPEIATGIYTNFQIISHSSSEFGKIQMPNQQPRTATPFGPVKNDA